MDWMESDVSHWIQSQRVKAGSSAHLEAVPRLMAQLLGAVEHLHASGLIHRDIKPSNILINSETLLVKVSRLLFLFSSKSIIF